MAVIVDLDDDTPAPQQPQQQQHDLRHHHVPGFSTVKPLHHSLAATGGSSSSSAEAASDERPNPNVNGFSAALSCYPVVRQLASQLDLNSLHNLSRTCRQFRANLLEYRDQLIRHTLRCDYEQLGAGTTLPSRLMGSHATSSSRQLTRGRVGECARDMVGECQRCASVVCRNCSIKPPPTPALRARHRRLCRACSKAPLHLLTAHKRPRSSSTGTPSPPASPNPRPLFFEDDRSQAFTASAFGRGPCPCDDVVWLCQPCGQDLKKEDTLYIRAWTWRTRYSHYLGGVGTGAGEGNEGVECGRGPSCLAGRTVEHEINYEAETPPAHDRTGESSQRWTGTSYHAQEIEGIGGVVKMKHKRQVRVGETVKIYEDERDKSIQYLGRENSGKLRSWCSWCDRVVLSEKDIAEAEGRRPPSSGSSSTSSSR